MDSDSTYQGHLHNMTGWHGMSLYLNTSYRWSTQTSFTFSTRYSITTLQLKCLNKIYVNTKLLGTQTEWVQIFYFISFHLISFYFIYFYFSLTLVSFYFFICPLLLTFNFQTGMYQISIKKQIAYVH